MFSKRIRQHKFIENTFFFCKSLLQATMDKQLNKLQKDRQVVVANEYSSSTFHQNKTTSILHRDKT